MKIAVASSDGKNVDLHFSACDHFLIFEIQSDKVKFLELREKPNITIKEHSDRWKSVCDLLGDCDMILCAKIGPDPRSNIEDRGVTVLESSGLIEGALKNFL
ncbi:NifB/NifX family molybdenum-iron cluster-binding protein [Methanobacterium aggregans]|uniref:NifB/NifX family molybdenum-iron cluster-binding protein n=1 Tax=Methanobacterium aggregans TaxID=1615586 RepID=UPI001AE1884E|nr:NifB/NifX family molybdenum-iron cluster-binding protein [Methanobacterium aggregans]MBP2046233.1 putative Fe-Mo cluster-binding NifX family protein [Methanobacterium aggregans]